MTQIEVYIKLEIEKPASTNQKGLNLAVPVWKDLYMVEKTNKAASLNVAYIAH